MTGPLGGRPGVEVGDLGWSMVGYWFMRISYTILCSTDITPHLCMEIVQYKYFLKIYTLLQIWWWRHDDVIILTSYWRKSLPNRIELAAAATFERNKIESCMTPHFLANALGFTKKRFPTIRYGIIISCHQLIEAKIFDLGENLVWRHNDVTRTPNLDPPFSKCLSCLYLTCVQR